MQFNIVAGRVDVAANVRLYYEIRSTKTDSSDPSLKLLMIMGAFATMKHFEEQANHLVETFQSRNQSIEVLTYDHRGIGRSTSSRTNIRQTSQLLAQDASNLVDHVWSNESMIHLYGASLGGMVAQELALLLIPHQRLRSLYLAVTSRGNYIRPMSFGPTFWSLLMPFFIRKDREQMVRQVLLPATFSPTTLQHQGEIYAKRWIDDYDQWWAFDNPKACAAQCSVSASHYLDNQRIQQLRDTKILITVQIATEDKLMSPVKQQELATLLNAKTVVFNQGHLGDDEVKILIFQSLIDHIHSAEQQ